jgi:hypothetical protein
VRGGPDALKPEECIAATGVLGNGLTPSSRTSITRPRTSFFAFGAHRGGARDRLKA